MCWNFAIFGHCGIPLNFREEKTIPGGLIPLYTGGTNSRFVSQFSLAARAGLILPDFPKVWPSIALQTQHNKKKKN
jgi:hypothetical protein